jgi:hypothetical protein
LVAIACDQDVAWIGAFRIRPDQQLRVFVKRYVLGAVHRDIDLPGDQSACKRRHEHALARRHVDWTNVALGDDANHPDLVTLLAEPAREELALYERQS